MRATKVSTTGTTTTANTRTGGPTRPVPSPAIPEARSDHRDAATGHTDRAAHALLAQFVAMPADHPGRPAVRARLIEAYLPLATHLAHRYSRRSEPLDDLIQVASVALIKSVDRYDPARGTAFTTYAIPMILGELKRHFRDKTWNIRVPRPLQELWLRIGPATAELSQQLGHAPTVAELAAHLDVHSDDIAAAIGSGNAYHPPSLNTLTGHPDGTVTQWADLLGSTDPGFDRTEYRVALRPLIAALPARERRIIALHFFHNMNQSQIAGVLGISQMHVSRLLSHAMSALRGGLLT
jgi:RNA polymerase sigma-B factor